MPKSPTASLANPGPRRRAPRRRARVPPAQQRLTKTERRRQLVETAQRVFAACGFKGTTTRDLARAAGVSEAVIFQHFQNKAELYATVLEDRNDAMWPEAWVAELEAKQRAGDDAGFL